MSNKDDLTEGSIIKKLIMIAAPIMGMNFLQMAYNLTDMFWLGRVGTDAVAAAGAGGMYLWLASGVMLIPRMGAEIGVAQSIGKGDRKAALEFSKNALALAGILGFVFGLSMIFFSRHLAAFFPFAEETVARDTRSYIFITGMGLPAAFIAAVLSGTFTASGNSRAPFVFNGIGLICNVLLDPLFIFGFGLGLRGAAIATIIAQWTVAIILFIAIHRMRTRPFPVYGFKIRCSSEKIRAILVWGIPVGLEMMFFCFLTMLCSRLEASFGANAVAAGKIGTQMESLTWLIGGGFGSALVAFIGQNYGALKTDRIREGVRRATGLMTVWGIVVTIFIITLGPSVFALFLPEPELVALGRLYISIFVFCQLPMNLEAVASGAFKGLGRTLPPSIVSIVSNILKPVIAYILAGAGMGIAGVWIGVCFPDIIRCVWVWAWYLLDRRHTARKDCTPSGIVP